MRITFLGTSHGSPEPNRRCSATLIEACGRRYLVDMGTQVIEPLKSLGIAPEEISAIFITHMHGDHTNGLIPFLDLASWRFKTADPAVYLPSDPAAVTEAIGAWLALNGTPMRSFRLYPVSEGLLYEDGCLRVTAYRTRHTAASFAYLLEAEGKRVLFSGDLSHTPAEDFPRGALTGGLDLAVCEAAHFEATAYLPILGGELAPRRLLINHYSPRRLAGVMEAIAAMPCPADTATDGLVVEV